MNCPTLPHPSKSLPKPTQSNLNLAMPTTQDSNAHSIPLNLELIKVSTSALGNSPGTAMDPKRKPTYIL